MSATSTRPLHATARKKAVEDPATDVELPPPEGLQEGPSLDDAILEEVLNQFDRSGIIGALAEKMAPRLAGAIKLDELAASLLERRQERLSAQLVERLLEKLGG